MNIAEQFRCEVEGFLKAAEMTPTAFGKEVLGDPRFVFDLRNGRACSSRTMDKVLAYIAERQDANRQRAS